MAAEDLLIGFTSVFMLPKNYQNFLIAKLVSSLTTPKYSIRNTLIRISI